MSLQGKAEHEKAFGSAAEWGGGAGGVVAGRSSPQDVPVTPLPGGLCPGPEPRRVHPSSGKLAAPRLTEPVHSSNRRRPPRCSRPAAVRRRGRGRRVRVRRRRPCGETQREPVEAGGREGGPVCLRVRSQAGGFSEALPAGLSSSLRNPVSLPPGSPRGPLPSRPAAFSKVVFRWLRRTGRRWVSDSVWVLRGRPWAEAHAGRACDGCPRSPVCVTNPAWAEAETRRTQSRVLWPAVGAQQAPALKAPVMVLLGWGVSSRGFRAGRLQAPWGGRITSLQP